MRTVRRLRLRCFFFLQGCSCAVHSATLDPIDPVSGPSEEFY